MESSFAFSSAGCNNHKVATNIDSVSDGQLFQFRQFCGGEHKALTCTSKSTGNLFRAALAFYWNAVCKRLGRLFCCIEEILIAIFVLLPKHKELWYIYFYICIYSKYHFQKIFLFDKSFFIFFFFMYIFIFSLWLQIFFFLRKKSSHYSFVTFGR